MGVAQNTVEMGQRDGASTLYLLLPVLILPILRTALESTNAATILQSTSGWLSAITQAARTDSHPVAQVCSWFSTLFI